MFPPKPVELDRRRNTKSDGEIGRLLDKYSLIRRVRKQLPIIRGVKEYHERYEQQIGLD